MRNRPKVKRSGSAAQKPAAPPMWPTAQPATAAALPKVAALAAAAKVHGLVIEVKGSELQAQIKERVREVHGQIEELRTPAEGAPHESKRAKGEREAHDAPAVARLFSLAEGLNFVASHLQPDALYRLTLAEVGELFGEIRRF